MNVIVVGCGRMGAELAFHLSQRKHNVVIVDTDLASFARLSPDFLGRTLEGDALSQDVLRRAGIETADALVAATESDTINMVIGHVAKEYFHVPNVVARNYSPEFLGLYETFNLQVVSATGWAAQRMEELLYHSEIKTIFSAGNGEVEIYEISIPELWGGKKVSDLIVPGIVPVALSRAGRAVLPEPDQVLQVRDVVHVSGTMDGIEALRTKINSLKKEA